MKNRNEITTWNALWSKSEEQQKKALARATSIHPFGRNTRKGKKSEEKNKAEAS